MDLTWIRAAQGAPERPRDAPVVPPPLEVIARLSELALRGRIQDLVQELSTLEEEDPRLGPWLAEVRALAEGFQVRELRARLARGAQ